MKLQPMKDKITYIVDEGSGQYTTVPDPPKLSKRDGNQVLWVSTVDADVVLRFPKSEPFGYAELKVEAKGWQASGEATSPSRKEPYPYTITKAKAAGVSAADPGIKIDP